MKILAFSDVVKWEGYEGLVDEIQPDVICLAGDLTSDGFATFWSEAIEQIPSYQEELKRMNIKFERIGDVVLYKWINNKPKKYKDEYILDIVESIKQKYKDSKEFLEIRKKMHVDKFYAFLKYAGKKSKVLIIKGDHDEDFKGDYIDEKINETLGCKEISGECVNVNGFCFVGLGFTETHYLEKLKPLIERFKEKVDVVVTHCEQKRLPLISLLRPKLIIRGHFGFGKYLVNDIPSVFLSGVKYTVIELEKDRLPQILQYIVTPRGETKILEKYSCRPWFSKVSEFERYKWLKPYPER